MKFAELESLLGDVERARGIFELAVNQPRLDMPELLWKQYIDFEIEQEEPEKARKLYRRLLSKTSHVKVWLSLAQFELSTEDGEDNSRILRARKVYEEANQKLREAANDVIEGQEAQAKEFRLMLLETWRDFEHENEDEEGIKKVAGLMPKRVKKRRKIEQDEDAPGGSDAGGWEEYFDYIFPEDESSKPNLKLLAMAKMWKKQKETVQEPEVKEEAPEERIPITEDEPKVDQDNPDADDEDIRNESSSSEDEESEDDSEPKSKRKKA